MYNLLFFALKSNTCFKVSNYNYLQFDCDLCVEYIISGVFIYIANDFEIFLFSEFGNKIYIV